MNIGAGRIIYQDLTRITKAIEDGDFFDNKVSVSSMYIFLISTVVALILIYILLNIIKGKKADKK